MSNDTKCPATAYPECLERLTRIETMLTMQHDLIAKSNGDVEARLRSLEETRSQAQGGARVIHFASMALGGAAGAGVSWMVGLFKHVP